MSSNNTSSPIYGTNNTNNIVINGSNLMIPSNGFYLVNVYSYQAPTSLLSYSFEAASISLGIQINGNGGTSSTATYNVANNKFSINLTGMTSGNSFYFRLPTCVVSSSPLFGDNLADGTIETNGSAIIIPNLTSTPKNFRVDLTLNFNGSGNYTITQIP